MSTIYTLSIQYLRQHNQDREHSLSLKMANVMRLGIKIVKFPAISLMDEVLNRRQCENLFLNFQNGVQALQSITSGHNKVFHKAKEDLYQIIYKAKVLIEDCCREDWCRVVVTQLTNKECFRELLLDFENCFHTICDISCLYHLAQESRILAIKNDTTFYPTSIDAIKEDQTSICGRFSKHLDSCTTMDCDDCKLAQYLKEYLRSLQHVEGGGLDKIDFPYDYPRPKYIGDPPRLLVQSGKTSVFLTNWLGLESVTKVFDVCDPKDINQLWKEASILGGLNHPNIIKFYCCGFLEVEKQFELVMEYGKKTLSDHLNEKGPLEETNAMEIMLQIANGMCYLHDMKVAHRDLKPGNVVVSLPNDSTLINLRCIQVKLLDFGISKVEVKDYKEVPTGRYIGTHGYMAPEIMTNELSEVDALKADVFSFGMLCSDILSAKKHPFDSFREYRKYILEDSSRPKLPESYSEGLRSMVHDCWSSDPLERPTFLDIHNKLTSLKRPTILKGVVTIGGATNDTRGSLWKVSLSYLCFVLVSWIRYLWFIFKFKHANRPTLFPSAQKVSNGSSSNPFSMKVSVWLSL